MKTVENKPLRCQLQHLLLVAGPAAGWPGVCGHLWGFHSEAALGLVCAGQSQMSLHLSFYLMKLCIYELNLT